MARHYYGTKSALDWILAHYFFAAEHYSWLASCFYPYRLANPASSNPLKLYQGFYEPWKDKDAFDRNIAHSRLTLYKGIKARVRAEEISPDSARELKDICHRISTDFFYPIVLRVDLERIEAGRCSVEGSGASAGSAEVLVKDLREDEFDVLFLDWHEDSDFHEIVCKAVHGDGYMDSFEVLELLKQRTNQ